MKDAWHPKVDWRRELGDEERERLRDGSVYRDYAVGDMIFAPEPSPACVYLLEEGLVRIYRLSREGSETTFGYVAPGQIFGELAAFADYPRESFAQAVRRSRVWRIPRAAFQRALADHPNLFVGMIRQISERLKRIESRVEHLVFRDVRSRVAHILLELAGDFGEPSDEGVIIAMALTQSEIATLVGSTRQSVNVSLRELEQEGLVGRAKTHIVVRKPEELRHAAEFALPT